MSAQKGKNKGRGIASALEGLQESPEFRGPVEPIDDHDHATDHFALLYEDRDEQFAAAVPFVRHGLERGEQVLYIADENTRGTVLDAMREGGIDVDAAVDSGALLVHEKQDAYLRDGTFDPDEMIGFLADVTADALAEFEGLRVIGEMTWIFGEDPEMEDLLEYEAKLNDFFSERDAVALCEYNVKRFPAEVVRDVIHTHPHIISENVVTHNVYYTPPGEFFGPASAAHEVDRMKGTLLDGTRARAQLEDRTAELEAQNERLDRFASTLAHELRNPVQIGQGYAAQIPREAAPEAVDSVRNAFDRINDMVDVLLTLARGREAVGVSAPVDLAAVARQAWDDADVPRASLAVDTGRTVRADETFLRHLFANLFENAVTHAGADATVTVGDLPNGFFVADDGPGIPADEREMVFETGYTTERGGRESGLGLAYVREFAEAYGWTCTLTDSEAGGARFEFTDVDDA